MKPIKVIIVVKGGLVEEVNSNVPLQYVVVDVDDERDPAISVSRVTNSDDVNDTLNFVHLQKKYNHHL
jgi:hypothetical protein